MITNCFYKFTCGHIAFSRSSRVSYIRDVYKRQGGMRGMLQKGVYTKQNGCALQKLWAADVDADPSMALDEPWLQVYLSLIHI